MITTGEAVITVTHFITYMFDPIGPGGPSHSQTVEGRNPYRDARQAPTGVSAFYYHDLVGCTVAVDGDVVHTTSQPLHVTRKYFVRAGVLDIARTYADHVTSTMV
jgi:hypothetical protein